MEKSLNKLLQGYQNFRERYASNDSTMRRLMDADQKPQTMIISCCDSRVDPTAIFECDPGDIFVVRNIANIVPPYEKDSMHHGTSAALEFGVNYLKVKHLVILGHSNCGGIKALMEGLPENDFLTSWITISKDALKKCEEDDSCSLEKCIKLSLNESYKHCMTFPWIKEKVEKGELQIHRWFINLQTGIVEKFNPVNENFENLPASV